MNWFKKHVDTVVVLGGILCSFLWMQGKFSNIDEQFNKLNTEIAVIKTVLIMQKIMPQELAAKE
jgi:hypothetical protein